MIVQPTLVTRDGGFPRVQHPEAPDRSGISPNQPGEAPPKREARGNPRQPPPAIGKGKPPPQPRGKRDDSFTLR